MKSGDFPGLQNQRLADREWWVRFPSTSAIRWPFGGVRRERLH